MGTRAAGQIVIAGSLSTHINNEERLFLSFVPMKMLFALMSLLHAKLQID